MLRKSFHGWLATLCVAVGILASRCVAQDIANAPWDPGFEQGVKWWGRTVREQGKIIFRADAGQPGGEDAGVSIGPGLGISGSGGLVMESSSRQQYFAFVNCRTAFPVQEKRRYVLECSYNGDIASGWAGMEVRFRGDCRLSGEILQCRKNWPKQEMLRSPRIKGSTHGQWQTMRFPFLVPDGAEGVAVTFIGFDLSGRVAFDDLKLRLDEGKAAIPHLGTQPDWLASLPSEDFLRRSVQLTDFIDVKSRKLAEEQTVVHLGMGQDTLYGVILLHHPHRAIPTVQPLPRDSGGIFTRESIEFFISQVGGGTSPYYHFAMDTAGSLYDAQESMRTWDSAMQVASTELDAERSQIRFALPLRDLGFQEADRGLVQFQFRLNFCRNHRDGQGKVGSSWAPVDFSFHEIDRFPVLQGDGQDYGQVISGLFLMQEQATGIQEDRFWKTDRRIYRELFSDTPTSNGVVSIWCFPVKSTNLVNALQYGYQYSLAEILEEYRKYRLHPHVWMKPPTPDDSIAPVESWCRQTGLGAMVYFSYWGNGCTALYNDKVADKLFQELEEYLERHKGAVMGVHLGDECLSVFEESFINRARNPKQAARAATPEFQEALRRVRDEYGYGRFGLPSSLQAENEPFQWLATRKFIIDRMLQFQERLYGITRRYSQADGTHLLCQTATGREQTHLFHPERFAPWCDLVALQSNPARLHRLAFMAKFMTDLSQGKPVSAVDHLEHLYGAFGAEKTAACLSQLARGGVTGLIRWGADHINGRRLKNGSIFCRYGHRPRWNTLNETSLVFSQMPRLRFPRPEYAVLLSQDSALSKRANSLPEDEAFFGLAGPAVGTWFQYISDIGLLEGRARLEEWRAVFIVKGQILDPKVTAMVERYLNQGGTVICLDTEFASFAPDGTDTTGTVAKLFGAVPEPLRGVICYRLLPGTDIPGCASFEKGLSTFGGGKVALRPTETAVSVLAKFENGLPVVTMKRYPQGGRAILCSLPPFFAMSEDSEWKRCAETVFRQCGISVKQDIWDFHFPFEPEHRPDFSQVCLTGNHFYWWRNQPTAGPNVQLDGAEYSLSLPPDHLKGQGHSLVFPLPQGNLTNREAAFEAGDLSNRKNAALIKAGKLSLEQFADTWTTSEGLRIRFRFPKPVKAQRLKLFFQGVLPPFEVRTSGGLASSPGQQTDQVLCHETSLDGTPTDFLEIALGKQQAEGKLILSEVEIWGQE